MEIEDTEYEVFLHQDEYYKTEWENIREFGWARFNWFAFLFGLFWMLYRKMFLIVFLIVGVVLLEYIGEEAIKNYFGVSEQMLVNISRILNIVTALLIGSYGNKLYLWDATRKIKKLQKRNLSEETYYLKLQEKGGITFIPLIILAALLLVGLLYFTLKNN